MVARTFKVEQRTKGRHFTTHFGLELSQAVPERTHDVALRDFAVGGERDVDVRDDPAVLERLVQHLARVLGDGVAVQFVVARRDDIVRHLGEERQRGRAFRARRRLSIDESVAVDSVSRIDQQEIDSPWNETNEVLSQRFWFLLVVESSAHLLRASALSWVTNEYRSERRSGQSVADERATLERPRRLTSPIPAKVGLVALMT